MKNQLINFLSTNQPVYLASGDKLERFEIIGMQIKEAGDKVKILYQLRSVNPETGRTTSWLSHVPETMWASEDAYFHRCPNNINQTAKDLVSFLQSTTDHSFNIEMDNDGYIFYTGYHCEDGVVTPFKEPVDSVVYLEARENAYGYKILPKGLPERTYCDMEVALTVCDTKVSDENGIHVIKSPKTLLALSEVQQKALDEAMAAMEKVKALGVKLVYDDGDGGVYAINRNGLHIDFDEDYSGCEAKNNGYRKVDDITLVSARLAPLNFDYKPEWYCLWVKESEKTEEK